MHLLSIVGLGLLVFLVPGLAVARALRPDDCGLMRWLGALLAGPTVIGWVTVAAAVATGLPMTLWGLLGVALGVTLLAGIRGGRANWTTADLRLLPGERSLALGAVVVGLLWLIHYDRELFQLNCVNNAAALVFGEGRGALSGDYLLAGNRNVRLGNTCLVSPSFIAFGLVGARLLYAWTGLLLFGFMALLVGRCLPNRRWLMWAGGLLMSLNPWTFAVPILDENNFASLYTLAIMLALTDRTHRGLWLGLLFGMLVGVRHIGLLLLPALALFAWRRKVPIKTVASAALAGGVAATLWAWHHHQVFGSILGFESFAEYRTPHPHGLLGWSFDFHGLLNWPFHERLVRTPYNAFPMMVAIPLAFVTNFGVLLVAALPGGLWKVRRGALPTWWLLVAALPIVLMMSFIENSMQPNKLGIVLQVLPCMVLPLVAGLDWLASRRPAPWLVWFGSLAALLLAFLGVSAWEPPVDERVYTLETPVRVERDEYRAWERERALGNLWLPAFSRVGTYSAVEPGRKLGDLAYDLLERAPVLPAPRPVDTSGGAEAPVRIVLDLSSPLIGRTNWVRRAPDEAVNWDPAAPPKARFMLPMVPWAELPPTVGVAYRADLARLDVALEFGEMHWFADLLPEATEGAPTRLQRPYVVLEVPAGTRIRVTEVVADHFSRYYRWWLSTAPLQVTPEPTVVFTN